MVDGTINSWAEDGEPRQDVPEGAVEEFKISNALYKAEFGLATGGVVQVVTKSGTNILHGNAFEYFRDKSLNAIGKFETVKPDYRRHQLGGSVGGAVIPNRMHYYGSVERTQIDEFYTVRTGLPQFYSSVEGTFKRPTTRNLYFGRTDWQISNTQNFFARYLQEDELTLCVNCGGLGASTIAGLSHTADRDRLADDQELVPPGRDHRPSCRRRRPSRSMDRRRDGEVGQAAAGPFRLKVPVWTSMVPLLVNATRMFVRTAQYRLSEGAVVVEAESGPRSPFVVRSIWSSKVPLLLKTAPFEKKEVPGVVQTAVPLFSSVRPSRVAAGRPSRSRRCRLWRWSCPGRS